MPEAPVNVPGLAATGAARGDQMKLLVTGYGSTGDTQPLLLLVGGLLLLGGLMLLYQGSR